ncbi:MAG: hypothetical protein FJ403_15755 [Verrucomicrobia bacterium]|nr:hypothetical protein [Verrucomicrobiota bacterium]
MNLHTIREIINTTKLPVNVYAPDGRNIYLNDPESILITAELVTIGSGTETPRGVPKEATLLASDHIVRIERTRCRPLRKVA